MVKENVRLKDKLSETDKINIINFLVDGNFKIKNDGSVAYIPYFGRINDRIAFFLYAVEGLAFADSEVESIYEVTLQDEELCQIYNSVRSSYSYSATDVGDIRNQYNEIDDIVKDMIEFEKQKIIHSFYRKDSLSELLDEVTKKVESIDVGSFKIKDAFDLLKKIAGNKISEEKIVDAFIKTDVHTKNEKAVLQSKNEHTAKNVINYPKARNKIVD